MGSGHDLARQRGGVGVARQPGRGLRRRGVGGVKEDEIFEGDFRGYCFFIEVSRGGSYQFVSRSHKKSNLDMLDANLVL